MVSDSVISAISVFPPAPHQRNLVLPLARPLLALWRWGQKRRTLVFLGLSTQCQPLVLARPSTCSLGSDYMLSNLPASFGGPAPRPNTPTGGRKLETTLFGNRASSSSDAPGTIGCSPPARPPTCPPARPPASPPDRSPDRWRSRPPTQPRSPVVRWPCSAWAHAASPLTGREASRTRRPSRCQTSHRCVRRPSVAPPAARRPPPAARRPPPAVASLSP